MGLNVPMSAHSQQESFVSASKPSLRQPRTKLLQCTDRKFSSAASTPGNQLPDSLRTPPNSLMFPSIFCCQAESTVQTLSLTWTKDFPHLRVWKVLAWTFHCRVKHLEHCMGTHCTIGAVHPRDNAHDNNRIGSQNSGCTCQGYMMNVHDGHALVVCLRAKWRPVHGLYTRLSHYLYHSNAPDLCPWKLTGEQWTTPILCPGEWHTCYV